LDQNLNHNSFEILKGNEIQTTNNRMEMMGVIEALRYIVDHNLENAEINL
jgi:ribonuclease HI